MTLSEKSLITIELPQILDMLAYEAISKNAKDAALELRPSSNIQTIRSMQSETTAAKNMMVLKQSPPFSGVKDIREAIKRADIGGVLTIRELLDAAELLRSSSSSVSYFKNDKGTDSTAIDYLFTSLHPNKQLETRISTSIISEEEISDNASSDLATIRRKMRLASDKIRQTLNKIITSQTFAKALQEPIITMRNDRYVVPVKTEQKSAIPGLVHDISSSGATQFIEPMTVVNINNELRELAAAEKHEIERILAELSAAVSEYGDDIVSDFQILTKLDFVFAKAKLSYKLDSIEPELSQDMVVKLNQARHPLLSGKTVVPIDIRLGGEFDTLIITGPNTGGKTVSLKTLGLLCAMAECGLHIPAKDGSVIPVLNAILADIGDEQSIEQSLSTFSSHMTNIVQMLENCEHNSLLMFDELGAGTDPVEGAALAISIIEHARRKGVLIAATTHYAELKSYAVTSQGVVNASCEFDVESLRPTYKLIIGIPGKSNAFAISKRLGLSDKIIDDAKNRVSSDNVQFDDALANLEETRLIMESEKSEVGKLLREADADRRQAEELKARLTNERDKAADIAKREASKIIEDARRTAESVLEEVRSIHRMAIDRAEQSHSNEAVAEMFRKLNEAENSLSEPSQDVDDSPPPRDIKAGDTVRLRSLGIPADVISVSPDGVLSLQAGIMKVSARINEVSLVEGNASPVIRKQSAKSEAKLREMVAKPEVDLRGMQADEAIPAMERFLDTARMAKLNVVTIIHGKGTGALRSAVHNYLKRDRQIASYRLGRYGEGEDGVTIVEL